MMRFFTRTAILFLFLSLAPFALTFAAASVADPIEDRNSADPFPGTARSYVMLSQGQMRWAHDPDRRLPMASLTKMMTAMLVLKKGGLDGVVEVSRAAADETGSRLGIRQGEKYRARDLLTAMLVKSANDACHALADYAGGDEKNFVRMMNGEASVLGLSNTRFTNACGHDNRAHYTTARDLAALATAALKYPVFSELVQIERARITTASGSRAFNFRNHNKLLGRYSGVMGVKTGYTRRAGQCIVLLAEKYNTKVLLVILHDPEILEDASAMLDTAFRYSNRSVSIKPDNPQTSRP